MKGALWIVGILLLVLTFVGVRLLLDNSAAANAQQKDDEVEGPPREVLCWGYFEVEKGIASLYPRQSGNVTFIHDEGARAKEGQLTKVKKDDLLLQIDDVIAQKKVAEAQADVEAGEVQLEEAKKLPELYRLQGEQQKASVKSAQSEIERFNRELESKLNSLAAESALAKIYRELAKHGEDQLKEKKNAEEFKLQQIQHQDAKLKIRQADADLAARKVRLEQAQEMVKHFKILAPADGYVLRVHVRDGETLGPNPRSPAIEFVRDTPVIVRAEVHQEWGRHVEPGADVIIEDDTFKGPEWKGVVKKVGGWYAPIRSHVVEPFRYNDVRTLECIIEVKSGDSRKLIGQRVRAKVKVVEPK